VDPKLEKQLHKEFPDIFRLMRESFPQDGAFLGQKTPIHGPRYAVSLDGLAIGDGWFNLLHNACQKLKDKGFAPHITAVQIKEKFGLLRFYYSTQDLDASQASMVRTIVAEAEAASGFTCERCGRGDTVETSNRRGPWVKTLCYPCGSEREKKDGTGHDRGVSTLPVRRKL
jgi:hypothetical protein